MTRRPSSWHLLVVAAVGLSPAALLVPARAGEVAVFEMREPVSLTGAERVYWVGTGASTEEALAFRDVLVDAGARHVNLFVPDMVIVCEVPPSASRAVAGLASARFRRQSAHLARTAAAADAPWGWVVEAYALADRAARDAEALAPAPGADGGFDDLLFSLAPERVEEVQRELETARALGLTPASTQAARRITQNSEFLGGSILANFIYPESNGALEPDAETWSDVDLREARAGATAAFVSWQGKFPNMDIGFIIHHFERQPTRYEPILHDYNSDGLWVVDTMRAMGWGLFSSDPFSVVHEFNESRRTTFRTQWVVTSFIASSRNTPSHRFGSGLAPYTAYAYLGGPYMVEPFPAGEDPNGIGETLVYSQIVQHEIGHLFWTLDEYPGAPGVCWNRSGYLDWINGNITMTDPDGNQSRCEALIACIMHTATRQNLGRPWCIYSEGHLGVVDDDGNGVPEIFEAEPEIHFFPDGPETVTTASYTLRVNVKATAVPNENPSQGDWKVSYALPLREAKLHMGPTQIRLDALDGRWDEVEEDAEFRISVPHPGQRVVMSVQATNQAGYRSRMVTKEVYFAGVHFDRLLALPKVDRIEVGWETIGETFSAKFNVYRLDSDQSMPGTLIAENVAPVGTGFNGRPAYRVRDFDVTPGEQYRYYVEGVFELPQSGGTAEFRSQSAVVAQTAMVNTYGDVISYVAPNPTRGSVIFSVVVPTSTETSSSGQPVPTEVNVSVYDVRGRLVRAIKKSTEPSGVLTLQWDGTDQDGTPVPSGIYFLSAKAGENEGFRKILMMR